MRRFWIPAAAAAVVAAAIGAALIAKADAPAWSSRSPEALRELEDGLVDWTRFYRQDARAHFEKALVLDPELVAARLLLIDEVMSPEERKRLVGGLAKIDLAGRTPREKFMIARALAINDGKHDEAARLVDAFLAENPDDTWALMLQAGHCFEIRDFQKAEVAYRRIIGLDPNRVEAQNMLGYLSMGMGKFREAEERFRTYRFIAPDQANPHDSLAELLILVGRYDEARDELEEALRIKPDFCASYKHLLDLGITSGRLTPQDVGQIVARANGQQCLAEAKGIDRHGKDWAAFWANGCADPPPAPEGKLDVRDISVLRHRCLIRAGKVAEAQAMEDVFRSNQPKAYMKLGGGDISRAFSSHMEGVRAGAAGDREKASMLLQDADQDLAYWGDGSGTFKLFNQLTLTWILQDAGQPDAAAQVLRKVRAVNPAAADRYEAQRELWSLRAP